MEQEPKYLAANIREVLAQDPRTADLYVEIRVVGRHVFITGDVASVERRSAITEVVSEVVPDYEVRNETTLALKIDEPQEETLS